MSLVCLFFGTCHATFIERDDLNSYEYSLSCIKSFYEEKPFIVDEEKPEGDLNHLFCLPSGIEVRISHAIACGSITSYTQREYVEKISIDSLNSEFQTFSPSPDFQIDLRKKYGKKCNQNFSNVRYELTDCIIFGKNVFIQDNAYEICYVSKTSHVSEAINSLILSSLGSKICIELGEDVLIRFLDPTNTIMSFGLFVKLKNFRTFDRSEVLLYTFDVTQVTRPFIRST